MATKLTDYIKCYDGMFDESFCKSVIQAFNQSKVERIDREQRPSFNEMNISQRYIAKDPLWMSIQKHIQTVFIDAVELYMNSLQVEADFPARYSFEEYRIKQYDNNGYDQFKDHVDVGDYNSARRFLVMFLYLNDVHLGGATNFPKLQHAVTPECGRILLFPATWQYRHSGQPPESDKKYIVGTYLHYL
ncbi:2OG-Fe(II) oxygenase [Synechococcus phage S-SSM5]|jgi:hypothetical protein|uniref:2OG-Fe(II) oxygenase n=1 Tax=Synechococcus phage S-SSM5 TaxID=445685 RepID=E3SKL1_9CAUD|nr:2OG-Fe(II) oxygenase [Synechococcus phage S-SSM5]ADO97899.1 2OG-Fe(II) oxygenase [Synechococcus phage S-SSM5]|tara:strand:+ start:494 stop:1060 length:567 start_codon:yes stop_codon:yes gene_type:complete